MIALDFCREVLGWGDATNVSQTGRVYPSVCWSPSRALDFRFTDLNAVADAVRDWCDRTDSAVDMSYDGLIPGEWEVPVVTPASVEVAVHPDPCQALLFACVEASRKLKAGA